MKINCTSQLEKINDVVVVRIPKNVSAELPSRGMNMIEGSLNTISFQTPLEPDGKGSHWFRVDKSLQGKIGVKVGDTVTIAIEPIKEWPEPDIPEDLKKALDASPESHEVWKDTTTLARWDWIRWIRFTNNPETRKHRIDVSISKLSKGEKRPCCFNRNMCTVPEVSKKGVLL